MNLTDLQRQFRASLDPKAVSAPLPIRETDRFTYKMRLGVYQYAYRARIEESLEEDFPKTRKKVGKKEFSRLFGEFLKTEPCPHNGLAEVSQHFSKFLESRTDLENSLALSELADLEWTIILSEHEEEGETSNLGDLSKIAPEDFDKIRFQLHPSVYLREYPHSKTYVVIYRKGWGSTHSLLTKKQWALLKAIKDGASVKDLSDMKIQNGITEKQAKTWFSDWARKSIIFRYKL